MPSFAVSVTLVTLAAQAATAAPWSAGRDSRADSVEARTRWTQSRCYSVFQSYNGGNNVKNTNINKLIDASDATIDLDVLSLGDRDRRYRRQRVPQACVQYIQSYNAGNNVENTNENKLIDLSNLNLFANILSRDAQPAARTYEDTNEGYNIYNNNENKLVDLKGLDAAVNILNARDVGDQECFCRPKPKDCSAPSGGSPPPPPPPGNEKPPTTPPPSTPPPTTPPHVDPPVINPPPVESPPVKPPVSTPPAQTQHTTSSTATSSTSTSTSTSSTVSTTTTTIPPPPSNTPSKPVCKPGFTYIDEGHNVVNNNENKLLDLSNISLDINILSHDDDNEGEVKTVPGNYVCGGRRGCCVKPPTIGQCPGKYVFVNKGHNVVNNNENKLLDLSKLNLDINILSSDGRTTDRNVKGDWVCDSPYGCCGYTAPGCPAGTTWYSAGSNVYNNNENKLLDLSDLNLNINILNGLLGGGNGGDTKTAKNGAYTCQSQFGCCAKIVDGGNNVVNNNENKGLDLGGLGADINILNGGGKGGLLGNGGLLGLGL